MFAHNGGIFIPFYANKLILFLVAEYIANKDGQRSTLPSPGYISNNKYPVPQHHHNVPQHRAALM